MPYSSSATSKYHMMLISGHLKLVLPSRRRWWRWFCSPAPWRRPNFEKLDAGAPPPTPIYYNAVGITAPSCANPLEVRVTDGRTADGRTDGGRTDGRTDVVYVRTFLPFLHKNINFYQQRRCFREKCCSTTPHNSTKARRLALESALCH